MKPNAWLTTFGIFSLLAIGGAGFFLFKAKAGYDDSMTRWDQKLSQIDRLGKRVPYPGPDSQKAVEELVKTYEGSVGDLYNSVSQFQKPLNESVTDTEFQQLVNSKVEAFLETARQRDPEFVVNAQDMDEGPFYLGFDIYKTGIPSPEVVKYLDFELGAIDHLCRLLSASGAVSLDELTRDLIPGEEGAARDQQDSSVVHKYPVRITFEAKHEDFRKFLNSLSNDTEYFYIVRVMNVTSNLNTKNLERVVGDPGFGGELKFVHTVTKEVASQEILEEVGGFPDSQGTELQQKMAAGGWELANEDARQLMGNETVTVHMVVDIVRFVPPTEVQDDGAEKGGGKGGRPVNPKGSKKGAEKG